MKIKNIILVLLSFYCFIGYSQNETVDISEVIRETQQWNKEERNMKMVWWIPTKYWEIATKGDPSVTKEGMDQLMDAVDKYTLIAAVNVNITPFGSFSKDSCKVKLIDSEHKIYKSIPQDNIDQDTKEILNVLKPVLANSIGSLGESIEFFAFPRNNSSDQKIVSPTEDGAFTVLVNATEFNWDLPLSTFIPKLMCPKDNELMNGKWKFCPWHGLELVSKKENTEPSKE